MRGRLLSVVGAVAASLGTARGQDPGVSFRDQVAPILVEKCLGCHNATKALAGYRVDTYNRLMAETRAGRMIEPGKPEDSLLFQLVESNEPSGRMPKNSGPLPKAEVEALRRWIEQGASRDGSDPDADLARLVARAKRSDRSP